MNTYNGKQMIQISKLPGVLESSSISQTMSFVFVDRAHPPNGGMTYVTLTTTSNQHTVNQLCSISALLSTLQMILITCKNAPSIMR